MGVWSDNLDNTKKVVETAKKIEAGLYVARDIGGADPERMSPPNVCKYVKEVFKDTKIKVTVMDDLEELTKNFPLFEAVNRGASVVERHRGCVIFLEYSPCGAPNDTVYLVGKGVTYDTGGADIKAGGVMAGMSRDKCGAAAVGGFMKIVDELKPTNTKIIGVMSMVRNSVGSNCYVADELIKARSGATVRVGNTDAEGRMIMADVLCKVNVTKKIDPKIQLGFLYNNGMKGGRKYCVFTNIFVTIQNRKSLLVNFTIRNNFIDIEARQKKKKILLSRTEQYIFK